MTLFFCISYSDLEDFGMWRYKSPGAPSSDPFVAWRCLIYGVDTVLAELVSDSTDRYKDGIG
jgi:hypothetical protein